MNRLAYPCGAMRLSRVETRRPSVASLRACAARCPSFPSPEPQRTAGRSKCRAHPPVMWCCGRGKHRPHTPTRPHHWHQLGSSSLAREGPSPASGRPSAQEAVYGPGTWQAAARATAESCPAGPLGARLGAGRTASCVKYLSGVSRKRLRAMLLLPMATTRSPAPQPRAAVQRSVTCSIAQLPSRHGLLDCSLLVSVNDGEASTTRRSWGAALNLL